MQIGQRVMVRRFEFTSKENGGLGTWHSTRQGVIVDCGLTATSVSTPPTFVTASITEISGSQDNSALRRGLQYILRIQAVGIFPPLWRNFQCRWDLATHYAQAGPKSMGGIGEHIDIVSWAGDAHANTSAHGLRRNLLP
jgi:hypothetical protein